jgi:hypothetical protein
MKTENSFEKRINDMMERMNTPKQIWGYRAYIYYDSGDGCIHHNTFEEIAKDIETSRYKIRNVILLNEKTRNVDTFSIEQWERIKNGAIR